MVWIVFNLTTRLFTNSTPFIPLISPPIYDSVQIQQHTLSGTIEFIHCVKYACPEPHLTLIRQVHFECLGEMAMRDVQAVLE